MSLRAETIVRLRRLVASWYVHRRSSTSILVLRNNYFALLAAILAFHVSVGKSATLTSDGFFQFGWHNGFSWNPARIPSSTDDVIIRNDAVVNVWSDGAARDIFIGQLSESGALNVGGNTTTSYAATLSSRNAYVGYVGAGSASVKGPSAIWDVSESLVVGNGGPGDLRIIDGGTVSAGESSVGEQADVVGTVVVDGNSFWETTSTLFLGYAGSGTMTVSNGGTVSNNQAQLGSAAGSDANATISDPGSTWNNGLLFAGVHGSATVLVQNGASVSSLAAVLGDQAGSTGNISVTGPGSSLTADFVRVGYGSGGMGSLDLSDEATVATGNVVLGYESGATGQVELSGGATLFTGSAILGFEPQATGEVRLEGVDTKWNNTGFLEIGREGQGIFQLSDGAIVNSADVYLGSSPSASGLLVVSESSQWLSTGSLYVGPVGLGSVTLESGASVSADTTLYIGPTGTVAGQGLITTPLVENLGILSPGTTIGRLEVSGDIVNGSTGALHIDISSASSFDVLAASGAAFVEGGSLEVSLLGGFMPVPGQSFKIMEADSLEGTFTSFSAPALSAGAGWQLGYAADGLYLNVVGMSEIPGDFDLDGDVDGRDFLTWQRDSSVGDLSDWQSAYGNSSLTVAASVPEPSVARLLLWGMWVYAFRRGCTLGLP